MPDLTTFSTIERFRRWGVVAWSIIGVLVLGGVCVWALARVDEIFPLLVVALVTVFVLNPIVTRLQDVGLPRIYGGCLTYIVVIGLVSTAMIFLVPLVIDQGSRFAEDLPRTVERVGETATGLGDWIEDTVGAEVDFREWIGGQSDVVADLVGGAGGLLRGAAETMVLVIIGLVLSFYLLVDLPRLRRATMALVPPDRRDEIRRVAAGVGRAMGGFFRGQLLVALIVAVMSAIGLWIIGLPYWAVVGIIAGLFNVIPLIGPFVGAIPAVLIAAALRPPSTILWVIVVLVVVQQIDNHFISPNVMRWSVKLHPVTIMLSLTVGATLGGLFGMLTAVPLAASLKVIGAHLWRTRIPWGEEVFEGAPPPT